MAQSALRTILDDRNITRYELSKMSGVPWATLSDLYSGKTSMMRSTTGTMLKLSKALDMSIEEMLDIETGIIGRIDYSDLRYLELNLPNYLQLSIDQLKEGRANKCSIIDCLMDDLYGSINSAMIDGEITERQAAYLRQKYLGMGEDDD